MIEVHLPTSRPCQENPELWFSTDRPDDRRILGWAIHQCRSHCHRLVECERTEARPHGGVLAGVLYVSEAGDPQPDRRQPREMPCAECKPARTPERLLKEPSDTGACGESRGHGRHARRGERPCDPCAAAKSKYQQEWARRKADAV